MYGPSESQIELGRQPTRRGSRSPAPGGAAGRLDQARLRILVVEDEFFVADHACDILEDAGYEVVGMAASADSAVEKAEDLQPDLVLMDVHLLGDRDGIDAALEIRDRFQIRTLFVSAYHDAQTRTRAAAADPVDFVAKPFTKTSLVAGVKKLLD